MLSNSQSYVKSFDGMAYELKGKIKEGESTADIDKVGAGHHQPETDVNPPPPAASLPTGRRRVARTAGISVNEISK